MTTYQELMLSVCFGVPMGHLLFGLGTLMTMKGQVTINEYGIA